MRRGSLLALAFLAALALGPARAEATRNGLYNQGWWMPIGATVGGVARHDGSGLVAGGEASLVYTPIAGEYFAGGYADALYDFGNRRTRVSIGPEVGWTFFGVDGGLALQVGGGRTDPGWYARGFFTLAFFSAYLRTGSFPGAPDPRAFAEAGLLFKWPFAVATRSPPRPTPTTTPLPPPPPNPVAL